MLTNILYLTMKKIVALGFLIVVIASLRATQIHEQTKPVVTPTPAPQPQTKPNPPANPAVKPATVLPAQPAPKAPRQPHKEPSYPSKPGNPFGRDTQGHRTCFQVPCHDPTQPCQVTVKPQAPAKSAAAAKTSTAATVNKPGAPTANAKTSTTAKANAAPAAATKPGKWTPILYVVRIGGKKARYAGFRCK